jgi:hypothetical protein
MGQAKITFEKEKKFLSNNQNGDSIIKVLKWDRTYQAE